MRTAISIALTALGATGCNLILGNTSPVTAPFWFCDLASTECRLLRYVAGAAGSPQQAIGEREFCLDDTSGMQRPVGAAKHPATPGCDPCSDERQSYAQPPVG